VQPARHAEVRDLANLTDGARPVAVLPLDGTKTALVVVQQQLRGLESAGVDQYADGQLVIRGGRNRQFIAGLLAARGFLGDEPELEARRARQQGRCLDSRRLSNRLGDRRCDAAGARGPRARRASSLGLRQVAGCQTDAAGQCQANDQAIGSAHH